MTICGQSNQGNEQNENKIEIGYSMMKTTEMNTMFSRVSETILATVYCSFVVAGVQGVLLAFMFWLLSIPSPILWGMKVKQIEIFCDDRRARERGSHNPGCRYQCCMVSVSKRTRENIETRESISLRKAIYRLFSSRQFGESAKVKITISSPVMVLMS